MLKRYLKKSQKGFTIIEVMIVLAIAGLIMVVVLIAIPQLQRNQRNSARTADATRLGTSIQNWITNNNGAVFTAGTGNANITAVINDIGATLNQYTLSAVTPNPTVVAVTSAAVATATVNTTLANLVVATGARCNGANVEYTGSRSFVILYAEETSSGAAGAGAQTCIAF